MRRAALPINIPFPSLTAVGLVVLLCCLMCSPTDAQAVMTPSTQMLNEALERAATPEAPPPSFDLQRPNLFRSCLGQQPAAVVSENSPQRKKKKKTSDTDAKKIVFLAWLAALCPPRHALVEDFTPSVVREDIPCLPSWRGFVFFCLPPPILA